jgi:hypothetical protein
LVSSDSMPPAGIQRPCPMAEADDKLDPRFRN